MTKSDKWIVAALVVFVWLMGFGAGRATARWPKVSFTGEPSRGVFAVPPAGIKYAPPPDSTMKDWECLVAVTGDEPAVWHYRVWREDEPRKALTGKGAVVVPQ